MQTMCWPWPAPLLAGAESKATAAELREALQRSAWGSRSGLSSQHFTAAAWRKTRQCGKKIQRGSQRHAQDGGSDADGAGWKKGDSRIATPISTTRGAAPALLSPSLNLGTQLQVALENETCQHHDSCLCSASFHTSGINTGVKRAIQAQRTRASLEPSL